MSLPLLFTQKGIVHTLEKKTAVAPKCIRLLSYGLGLATFYPLFLIAMAIDFITFPMAILLIYWGLIQLFLAYAVLCIYQTTGMLKIAAVGILLIMSGLLTFYRPSGFLPYAMEALAMTGISLILFDLGKAFPTLRLDMAGGIIFLGIIFSILNNQFMSMLGLAALLIGFLFSSARLNRIHGRKART